VIDTPYEISNFPRLRTPRLQSTPHIPNPPSPTQWQSRKSSFIPSLPLLRRPHSRAQPCSSRPCPSAMSRNSRATSSSRRSNSRLSAISIRPTFTPPSAQERALHPKTAPESLVLLRVPLPECPCPRLAFGGANRQVYFDKDKELCVILQRTPYLSSSVKFDFVRELWNFTSCFGFASVCLLASSDAARRTDEQIQGYAHPPDILLS
jgi:hypothetical protein